MFVKPKIERDPNVQQLEQNIFSRLDQIAKQHQPQSPLVNENDNGIRFVSFEEALKELIALNNK